MNSDITKKYLGRKVHIVDDDEEDEELALAKQIELEKEKESKSEQTIKELRGASNRLLRSVERDNAILRNPELPSLSGEAKEKFQARKSLLLEKMKARRNGTKINSKLDSINNPTKTKVPMLNVSKSIL